MARLGIGKRVLFASIPLAVLVLLAEILVRISGAAEVCSNRFSRSEVWVCDPLLQFRVNPDMEPNGKPLNSAGFRTHEFAAKEAGSYRILSLGDSCTFGYITRESIGFVLQPYPLRLERLIQRRLPDERVEIFNAGMPGYNSHHGIMLLKTRLRGLAPDLITIRYGWNDHFLSPDEGPDFQEPESALGRAVQNALLRVRLYAFVRRLAMELRALREPVEEQVRNAFARQLEWEPTVPVDRYRRNLARIVELGHDAGAEVWLLTAPRNRFPGEEAVSLMSSHNRLAFEELMEIHDDYNDAVRGVGARLGVPVIDMDRLYRDYDGEPVFVPTDIPHPTQGGHNLEAELLFTNLIRRGILQLPGG